MLCLGFGVLFLNHLNQGTGRKRIGPMLLQHSQPRLLLSPRRGWLHLVPKSRGCPSPSRHQSRPELLVYE